MSHEQDRAVAPGGIVIRSPAWLSVGRPLPADPTTWDMARAYIDQFGNAALARGREDVHKLRRCGYEQGAAMMSEMMTVVEWLSRRQPANDLP